MNQNSEFHVGALVSAFETLGLEPDDVELDRAYPYSGLTTDVAGAVIVGEHNTMFRIIAALDAEDAEALSSRLRSDSMGLRLVFYFPGITFTGPLTRYDEQEIDADDEEYAATPEEIQRAVEEAKREILDDLATAVSSRRDIMPLSVSTFSELHDYVDANEYGGLTDPNRRADWDIDSANAVQDALDDWLGSGAHRVEKVAMLIASMFSPAMKNGHMTWWDYTEEREGGREYWRRYARDVIKITNPEWLQ